MRRRLTPAEFVCCLATTGTVRAADDPAARRSEPRQRLARIGDHPGKLGDAARPAQLGDVVCLPGGLLDRVPS
jgi:hypothetical protein